MTTPFIYLFIFWGGGGGAELIPRHFLSYDDHLHILCFIDAVSVDNDPCRNETQEPLAVLNRSKAVTYAL